MTQIGTLELIATIDTKNYKAGEKQIQSTNKNLEGDTDNTTGKMNKSFSGVAKVGMAAVATAAVALGAVIVANIGGAIKRVDTLNNSSRTFAALGFDADTSKKAIDDLDKSIRGLPTPLDAAIRGMTSLAATYGDVSMGQKIFSALNNAILGFGGTAEMVDNAILQLSQLPMDGPLDAQTWNSLRNSGLTPLLVAMAKEAKLSVGELREQFGSGQLTVEDFTNSLIDMNKNGGGGMKSLEKLAKDSTNGIGTSFENLNTAITRAIANVIKTIGTDRIAGAIQNIAKFIDDLGRTIANVTKTYIQPFVAEIAKVFQELLKNEQVMKGLQTVLLALGIALGIVVGLFTAAVLGAAALAVGIGYLVGVIIDAVVNISMAIGDAINAVIKFGTQVGYTIYDIYTSIVKYFGGIGAWFKQRFTEAANGVRSAFSGIAGFFVGIWNSIVSVFSRVGAAIGNAIGSAFRSVINGVISYVESTVNSIASSINGIASGIDKAIPGDQSDFRVPSVKLPRLAKGGIVSSATIAMIGEGSEPEAVIPLSKLDKMLNGDGGGRKEYNIGVINIGSEVDGERWLRKLTDNQEIVSGGLTPPQKYMGA